MLRDIHGFQGIWSFAEIEPVYVTVAPRSNRVYQLHFTTNPLERVRDGHSSGNTTSFGAELVVDGNKKEVHPY